MFRDVYGTSYLKPGGVLDLLALRPSLLLFMLSRVWEINVESETGAPCRLLCALLAGPVCLA